MAYDTRLVERADLGADVAALVLTNFTDGFALLPGGLQQTVGREDDTDVDEALTLRVRGAQPDPDVPVGPDDLATRLQTLDRYVQAIKDSRLNPAYGVWLRTQAGETNSRQAFITDIPKSWRVPIHETPSAVGGTIKAFEFALKRRPLWESSDIITDVLDWPYGGAGSTYSWGYASLMGGRNGDAPARIARLILTPGNLRRIWLGFDNYIAGPTDNYMIRAWTNYNGTTAVYPGGGSNYDNEDYVQTNFTDGSDLLRAAGGFVEPGSPPAIGQYQVLARLSLSDGSTQALVRTALGYTGDDVTALPYTQRFLVSSANPMFYPLMIANIPPVKSSSGNVFSNLRLFINAQRVAGAGQLRIDHAVFVPMRKGYVFLEGLSGNQVVVQNLPSGDWTAHEISAGAVTRAVTVSGWGGIPTGVDDHVYAVGAGDRGTDSQITDTMTCTIYSYARWRTMRGAQGNQE